MTDIYLMRDTFVSNYFYEELRLAASKIDIVIIRQNKQQPSISSYRAGKQVLASTLTFQKL